jgi:hypothetical protein
MNDDTKKLFLKIMVMNDYTDLNEIHRPISSLEHTYVSVYNFG